MNEAVSLGWNCTSAIHGVSSGLRSIKQNGYKTCPFDEMISNYKGLVECINDDFKYFCDLNYLELTNFYLTDELIIYNKKYKFAFNHESPGHSNLYITQKWEKGINHFILNNYEEFIKRYNRRIQNFRDLLNSSKNITFILTRPKTQLCDIQELTSAILCKYPLLNFNFVLLDCCSQFYYNHLLLMKLDENDEEVKRLSITQ